MALPHHFILFLIYNIIPSGCLKTKFVNYKVNFDSEKKSEL